MDDFSGILARDFGFRPGKSAPMAASKTPAAGSAARPSADTTSWNKSRSEWNSDSLIGDRGAGVPGSRGSPPPYDDVFLGGGGYSNSAAHGPSASSASPSTDFDSIFDGFKDSAPKPSNSSSPPPSSMPVYDKPVYDDDIFDGVPGLKSTSSVKYDDVFTSMASASDRASSPPYEDLLENLGKPVPGSKGAPARRSVGAKDQKLSGFDDLIPGFGGSNPPNRREPLDSSKEKPIFSSVKPTSPVEEDPFKVFESVPASTYSSSGLFTDPLEHIGRPMNSGRTKVNTSPARGAIFDERSKSVSSFATEESESKRDQSTKKYSQDMSAGHHSLGREHSHQASFGAFENILPNSQPSRPPAPQKPISKSRFHNPDIDDNNIIADQSPKYHEHMEKADDIWLTVAEIPLFTQPTNAPPPSRSPPPFVTKKSPANINEFSTQSNQRHPVDDLEDFAMGKPQTYAQNRADFFAGEEEIETNSTAAASAMKEAMDRAEAKFKHAKEVRERERVKTRESQQQESEPYGQDMENNEEQESLDREQEEKEKEQRRLERVREQELERERERKAVERATREARERAAAEAWQRVEREKAEAERRDRERAAVQRAAAEARQRAAAEARQRVVERAEKERAEKERAERERTEKERAERERAEREAADARERASAERLRAERMAVERAAAEARKRAAEDARRRAAAAAAAAEEKQKKSPEEDLESFFGMGARATSAPTQRPTSTDNLFNPQPQTRAPHNPSSVSSSTLRKASSTANIVDDLSSIFGGPPSSGEFQEIEGETEERRRARMERHQRTAERAQKALAEKNERDRQAQMEQAERHRIGETLDFEIKRWAAGKEGNLRALLSTLQYVLWPECGWQPVSLTDLITAAAVKKVYRKATLCIHPDKVQQKGATIQQKYIAEKVFDLLKEAWNKFNSEELF